jgi:hypothetical protein
LLKKNLIAFMAGGRGGKIVLMGVKLDNLIFGIP